MPTIAARAAVRRLGRNMLRSPTGAGRQPRSKRLAKPHSRRCSRRAPANGRGTAPGPRTIPPEAGSAGPRRGEAAEEAPGSADPSGRADGAVERLEGQQVVTPPERVSPCARGRPPTPISTASPRGSTAGPSLMPSGGREWRRTPHRTLDFRGYRRPRIRRRRGAAVDGPSCLVPNARLRRLPAAMEAAVRPFAAGPTPNTARRQV